MVNRKVTCAGNIINSFFYRKICFKINYCCVNLVRCSLTENMPVLSKVILAWIFCMSFCSASMHSGRRWQGSPRCEEPRLSKCPINWFTDRWRSRSDTSVRGWDDCLTIWSVCTYHRLSTWKINQGRHTLLFLLLIISEENIKQPIF